jgi:hypothetical protein
MRSLARQRTLVVLSSLVQSISTTGRGLRPAICACDQKSAWGSNHEVCGSAYSSPMAINVDAA